MSGTADINELRRRMTGALDSFKKELLGLRTGRASVSLLEPIQVEAYGNHMPLSQLGTVGAPEARMLTVQVWDKTMVKAVEKAIREANLGVNPMVEGQLIRVPMPPLTEDRRKDLAKLAHKFAEHARVSGEVDRQAVFESNHVPDGRPEIARAPILDDRAAVKRLDHGDREAEHVERAADVHGGHLPKAPALHPGGQFVGCDQARLRLARHEDRVARVVVVPVRQQQQVKRADFLRVVRAGGIRREPRIDQDRSSTGRAEQKRRVAQPAERQGAERQRHRGVGGLKWNARSN